MNLIRGATLFVHGCRSLISLKGQVFTNEAFGMNATIGMGTMAAVSTADWNNDGWADITLRNVGCFGSSTIKGGLQILDCRGR